MATESPNRFAVPCFALTRQPLGGTGIGLWLSKQIMDAHGGKIRFCSSQRQGRSGTDFLVTFPIPQSMYRAMHAGHEQSGFYIPMRCEAAVTFGETELPRS